MTEERVGLTQATWSKEITDMTGSEFAAFYDYLRKLEPGAFRKKQKSLPVIVREYCKTKGITESSTLALLLNACPNKNALEMESLMRKEREEKYE